MTRGKNWVREFDCNPVVIAMSDAGYIDSKINDSSENTKSRAIYELFLSNLCFLVASLDGFCDAAEEDEYVRKCNFAQKSLYAEFGFRFKDDSGDEIEALVSTSVFKEVCKRVTMDHTYSQKMKLNQLARDIFRSNIGFIKFKNELLKASKVCLVKKEENLGDLSKVQKELAESHNYSMEAREIYTSAGIEVVNVYSENEIVELFEKLANEGISKADAKRNLKANFGKKDKSTNFNKISMKLRKEIISNIERI